MGCLARKHGIQFVSTNLEPEILDPEPYKLRIDTPQGPVNSIGKRFASIGETWYPEDQLPHLTFTMAYAITLDERLVRNEILYLVGIVITRLEQSVFSDHIVAPVRVPFFSPALTYS